MKVFEVNETLVIDEKTKNISCWVVKDIHSGKVVFFVKDNEVLIADENYMKILMEMMTLVKNVITMAEEDAMIALMLDI